MKSTMNLLSIIIAGSLVLSASPASTDDEEEKAKEYLRKVDANMLEFVYQDSFTSYTYDTNISEQTLARKEEAATRDMKNRAEIWKDTFKFNWRSFKDPDVRRQFKYMSILGQAALPDEKLKELRHTLNAMTELYSTATICSYNNKTKCNLKLYPDIIKIMSTSRDPAELLHAWSEWRKAIGPKCRENWQRYVELNNETARLNNMTDTVEMWLVSYDDEQFPSQVDALWQQIRPLYLQLHAYVRRRLRETYGEERVSRRGPLPAHLLGNMWAQDWLNVYDFTLPFPNVPKVDVTEQMTRQRYTPEKMFRLAEKFYVSLGLDPMTDEFWNGSMLEKPKDGREVNCHPTAYDLYRPKEFRIKMCTNVNFEDFQVIYHEMGHIQYYMQYERQPIVYRDGANAGFHEGIGEVMALSMTTRSHLREIGLVPSDTSTGNKREETLNFLYRQALRRVALMPYTLLIDNYRWGVFKGTTPPSRYNCDYWKLRNNLQGVEPPVERSEEDFDPAAKYHVVSDVPYIQYFVSGVIQFQIHRALCIKAKKFDPKKPADNPLHECNIYGSKEAGDVLKSLLQMGFSKPWPEAMQKIANQNFMDASGFLEYFEPLHDWLKKDNQVHGEYVGWEPTRRKCVERGKEKKEKKNGVTFSILEAMAAMPRSTLLNARPKPKSSECTK